MTASARTAPPPVRPVSPARLEWLNQQVTEWRDAGLVAETQADAILRRYRVNHRFSLARLLLSIGAAFVGVGLIWLVAANIEALPPTARFVAVCAIWLGLLVAGELLAGRRAHSGSIASPVVGSVRLLAALAFGAVIFQAAQSLQVPAWDATLVGCWGLGALVHAYAVRAVTPLVVAILAGSAWFVWRVVGDSPNGMSVVVSLLAMAVVAVSVAALHTRWAPVLGPPWRELGAVFALSGLFAAALPFVDSDDFAWTPVLAVVVVAAVGLAALAAVRTPGGPRAEVLGSLAVGIAAVALVLWDAGDSDSVQLDDVLHAAVSVVVYVAVAVAVAVTGTLRDSWRLTALATAALVVFTTFQSFAVFARILDGAWLFVLLGLVFLGTGFVFDRARRELTATLTDGATPTTTLTEGAVR